MNNLQKKIEGRPTKLTADTVKKLEDIFKVGGTIEEATSYAGITRQSYYNYLKEDQTFLTKMEAAQHYSDVVAKNLVVKDIVEGKSLDTAKWWLEKRQFSKPAQDIKVLNTGGDMKLEFFVLDDNEGRIA